MFMTNVGLKCFPAKRPTAKEAQQETAHSPSNLLHLLDFCQQQRDAVIYICHLSLAY